MSDSLTILGSLIANWRVGAREFVNLGEVVLPALRIRLAIPPHGRDGNGGRSSFTLAEHRLPACRDC